MNPEIEPNLCGMPEVSPRYADDAARLRVLESYEPDALEDDPELAGIVRFAAQLCDVPVSQVTLVEELRQRFLAREGIEERETPREHSFCRHTLNSDGLMEVHDASLDARFADNPLVHGWPEVRFYAGQPLVSEEGASLGALCAIDLKPRPGGLTPFQRAGMAVLAQAVMRRLNARRAGMIARNTIAEREQRLRRMIDGVPQIAWSANDQGIFEYFNRRWTETTGASPPKVAEDWRPFIHPEDQEAVFANWFASFAQGEEFEAEYRLRQADGSWHWILAQAVPVAEVVGRARSWFGTITDIDDVHRLSEARDLLGRELAHRIKNIFAVVIGLAMLKARATPEHLPFAEELTSALRALDAAHEFVRPAPGADGRAAAAGDNLHALLAALCAPYVDAAGGPRVHVTGADIALAERAATPIALVLHELATNAAKYGALSRAGGHVDLTVTDCGEMIAVAWREHGGPPLAEGSEEPALQQGFGSRLVEMAVTGQLEGQWERRFEPAGLVVELRLPRSVLALPAAALADQSVGRSPG